MNVRPLAIALLALAGLTPATHAQEAPAAILDRGRYVADTMGCNDCHTAGYAQSSGSLPESKWLTGSRLGHQGPWGTTYPSNLRIYMQALTEDEWVAKAHTLTARPPMPAHAVRRMDEADLRAFYALVRSLGPVGEPAPAYLPPGQAATGPVVRYP